MDLVPATKLNPLTVGLYDKVSGRHLLPTSGTWSAGPALQPAPDAPMDIVCNNGALKFSLNELNPSEIVIGYYRTSSTGALTESPYNFVTGYMPVKPGQSYVFFGRRQEDNRLSSYNRIHWFNANKDYISTNTYTKDNVGTGVAPSNAYFAQCSCNESGATSRVTTQEIVDGYNWVFQQGAAEVPYVPYVDGGLYTDGTVETIKLLYNHWDMTKASYSPPGFSRASVSVAQDGTFSITNSSGSSESRIQLTLSASVLGLINGQKYTLKVFVLDGNAFNRSCYIYHGSSYHIYPCDGTQTTLVDSWTQSDDNDVKVGYFYFKDYDAGTIVRLRVMVVAGETEPDTYQPYIENTATAEMLLKVGDYQDVQSIVDGVVTRNVGIKVLDGTESWSKRTDTGVNRYQANILPDKASGEVVCLCSHFQNVSSFSNLNDNCFIVNATARIVFDEEDITTLTDWKTWLADQYAAGTPVIVLYPLATPTTETVAGQTLQVTDGDNVLEITQAGMDGLELEAQYNAAVSLTIQEVEDANLDNNVEVTIQ
jgi:hypothetical protein